MKNLFLLLFFLNCLNVYGSLKVDDAETGTSTNSLGGVWVTFKNDSSSAYFTPDVSPGHAGSYCRFFEWNLGTGGSGLYAGAQTALNPSWSAVNLIQYYGVRFYAKGKGRYEITLPTDSTRLENNHYLKAINLTDEWKLYELPFSEFAQTWGTPRSWDPSTIFAVGFQAFGAFGMNGEIRIDDIEFYLESEAQGLTNSNIILLEPKINQVGYLTQEQKYFCIAADAASAGDIFFITNTDDDTVYSGSLSVSPINDTASTGEFVWKVDFSGLTVSGTYRIKINGKESYQFKIDDNVYENVFKDALRCFYLIRCGIAEDDPITGINRPACHLNDAKIRGSINSFIDAAGGWHNASDRGKFVNETAISISYMLWLYELRGDVFSNFNNNIPESGNGISDLLNEARWGLNWLLKMQKDDGTVYHKADSEPNLYFCPEPAPDQDPFADLRFVEFQKADQPQTPSSIDAGDFAAVMSQAARVFEDIDPSFSGICLNAARKSWEWLKDNKNTGQSDPYYVDPDPSQEYLWALGEMGRSLNNTAFRSEFSSRIDAVSFSHIGWGDPQLFGYLSLYYDKESDVSLKNKIKNKIISLCNTIKASSENSGYGAALQSWEYWWESNEYVMSKANCLLFGYQITGNSGYKDAALKQLNYILGLNSLNKSFVMSHGSNAVLHPYNWIYSVYGKAIPGWMAGGPNSKIEGADVLLAEVIAAGTPSAKCYIDRCECGLGSWACNEGETSENASLVFLAGCFYDGSINPAAVGPNLNIPLDCSLFQNFPNPFNPSTKIQYAISKPANGSGRQFVRLKVYDILGREVATLVNEEKPAGEYEIEFNGRSLASGIYFYKLIAGNYSSVRKMILLK